MTRNAKSRRINRISTTPTFEQLEGRRLMTVSAVMPNKVVVMQTSLGPIGIELLDETPISKANFLSYVNSGAYNNTVVHRTTFSDEDGIGVVQAGGYKASDFTHIPTTAPIANEFNAARPNKRGTLSMARTSDRNSATSEFFINTANNTSLDNAAQGNDYAVFASVIRGMGVADAINSLQHQSNGEDPFKQLPLTNDGDIVTINSAVARDEVTVVIGDNQAEKSVSYRDIDGTITTVSLTGRGAAVLKISGTGLTTTTVGGRVVIGGNNVELQRVDVVNTALASELNITPSGGSDGVTVGTINVAGGLKALNAGNVRIAGDVTSTAGIRDFTVHSVRGGTVSIGQGQGFWLATRVTAQSLENSSFFADTALLAFKVPDWPVTDGTSRSLGAPQVKKLAVPGRFGVNMNVDGTLSEAVLGTLENNNVFAGTLADVTVGSMRNSLIGSTADPKQIPTGIFQLKVRGRIDNSTIVTTNSISLLKLRGDVVNSDIIAGFVGSQLPTKGAFATTLKAGTGIGAIQHAGLFANSRISAVSVNDLRLSNALADPTKDAPAGTKIGFRVSNIGRLYVNLNRGPSIKYLGVDNQTEIYNYILKSHVILGKFDTLVVDAPKPTPT